jgi:hypothetical protein
LDFASGNVTTFREHAGRLTGASESGLETSMKKVILLSAALASALALGGCGYTQEQRTVNGAAVGGATGALLGAATTGRPGGAVAGALLGAAAGGIIGANSAPPPPPPRRCAEWEDDYYGRRHCTAWYD